MESQTDNPGAGEKNAFDGQPFGGPDTTQKSTPNMSISVGSSLKHKENKEWGDKKGSDICIMEGPGSRRWRQKRRNVWSTGDSAFSPKLLSESKLQIWKTQKTSIRINAETKRSKQASTTARLIIFKPQRIKDAVGWGGECWKERGKWHPLRIKDKKTSKFSETP